VPPLPIIAKGALIGGGVGLGLAVLRRPSGGQADDAKLGRVVKSVAEGALAGAAVAFVVERSLHRKAAEVIVAGAPAVLDTVAELAQRYEPAVERFAEAARDLAVGALDAAKELRAS
jgi:hypothetical protein